MERQLFKVWLAVSFQVLLVLEYSGRPIASSAAHVAQYTHRDLSWTLKMVTATNVTQITAVTSKFTSTLH